MIDPEVARLRRLRNEALRVRAIARAFESTAWAANEMLPARSACASWRIARVVSGRLRSHPFAQYQKDASVGAEVRHGLHARLLALTCKDRLEALQVLNARLTGLSRQLDDAIVLAWSSDFSEALSRSRSEIRAIGAALTQATCRESPERVAPRAHRGAENLQENLQAALKLEAALEGDWPYLAL